MARDGAKIPSFQPKPINMEQNVPFGFKPRLEKTPTIFASTFIPFLLSFFAKRAGGRRDQADRNVSSRRSSMVFSAQATFHWLCCALSHIPPPPHMSNFCFSCFPILPDILTTVWMLHKSNNSVAWGCYCRAKIASELEKEKSWNFCTIKKEKEHDEREEDMWDVLWSATDQNFQQCASKSSSSSDFHTFPFAMLGGRSRMTWDFYCTELQL